MTHHKTDPVKEASTMRTLVAHTGGIVAGWTGRKWRSRHTWDACGVGVFTKER